MSIRMGRSASLARPPLRATIRAAFFISYIGRISGVGAIGRPPATAPAASLGRSGQAPGRVDVFVADLAGKDPARVHLFEPPVPLGGARHPAGTEGPDVVGRVVSGRDRLFAVETEAV